MFVPSYSRDVIVNSDGSPSDSFNSFMDVLVEQLQMTLSNDGFAIPGRSQQEIIDIFDQTETGTYLILLNTDTNELNIKDANGNRKVIPLQNP